eukprot:c38105_g1_i1.p1 GENE.c38105_g1_i1~~c38105_g1_i1.p1  ORF type:complete len:131 (+),score=45.13 c38105_g1_i1:49-393(+)
MSNSIVIQFAESIRSNEGILVRAQHIGNVIRINMSHPDFVSRTKFNRSGKPVFSERLCSYLAFLISAAYCPHHNSQVENVGVSLTPLIDDIIDTATDFEIRLRKQLKQEIGVDE